jgi:aliphatic nitrilase
LSHEATVEKVAQKMHELGRRGVQFATFPESVMPTTRTFPQSRRASIEQPEMLGAG